MSFLEPKLIMRSVVIGEPIEVRFTPAADTDVKTHDGELERKPRVKTLQDIAAQQPWPRR